MRASSLALDMAVIVMPAGDDIQDVVRFSVTLTKDPVDGEVWVPPSPVRAHQSVMADLTRRTSVCALSDAHGGFHLTSEDGATIPYRVSLALGVDGRVEQLPSGRRHALSSLVAGRGIHKLRLEVDVNPKDLSKATSGRFSDNLCIAFG